MAKNRNSFLKEEPPRGILRINHKVMAEPIIVKRIRRLGHRGKKRKWRIR